MSSIEMKKETPLHKPTLSQTINGDWRFRYFPQEEEQQYTMGAKYSDLDWHPVGLPHTWSTYETTGELHPYILSPSEQDDTFWWYGWGWYRKEFELSEAVRGQKIFIELDGVMKYSKVWLNGEYIGEHKGGYASFSFDLTEYVRFGENNVLAIAVSNRRNDKFGGISPMTAGNFNVYGGIYRDVRLVVKTPVYIPFQGSADHEGGTFVTTPKVTDQSATVRVRTYVQNDSGKTQNAVLVTHILSPQGEQIQELRSESVVEAGELYEFDQLSEELSNPLLWSPEHPHLYQVNTSLFVNGIHSETLESPLGLRYFHWNYEEKRLYLNGCQIHIHGTNRHQEYPWLGDAIPKWMHDTDLHDIKYNLGHNFLRTTHYTQDKAVYEWCDRHGLLVCEEVPNIKNCLFGIDIQHQQVREMIRRDRNHPSIIMWSMGNETDHSADGAWAMAEDSSRIIHYRHVNGNFPDMQHTHDQMEMENLLRCTIRGWYNADVRDEEPVNGQHAGHEELQHDLALIDGKSQRGRIDVNGLMWIYHDHGCDREYLNAPLKHVNPKGWVDSYRVPKMMYYLWQAHWLQRPMVYIHAFDWTERYLGQTRCVKINSNCDKVELKLDGLSLGVMEPTKENGFTVVFPGITVTKGTLVAEGRRGDEVVVNELAMASVPEQIVLSTKQREIVADRTGISLVHVDIVDEKGVHVFGATNELKVTVTGPGKLVGPSVYTTDIDKADEMEGTMYIDTPFAIPVRSTTEPGTIIIEVSSSGLETGIIQIKSLSTSWKENGMIIEQPVPDAIGTYPCDPADLSSRPEIKFREVAPYQIMEIENDIDFTEIPADKLKHIVDRFIIDNNPGFQSYPEGFPYLIQQMMDHFQNERIMVADDYNFNIQCYNRFCRAVHRLRNSSLSKSEKSIKRQELADLYVRDRHEQEEMMF